MRAAIVLAAGLGTRMRSDMPKVMHCIAGRPMVNHLLDAAVRVFDRVVVVAGPGMDALAQAVSPHPVAVQEDRLGTAHAARMAAPLLAGFDGDVAVLYGDNPLVTEPTLRRLVEARDGADLVLMAMRPADPAKYGRLVLDAAGQVERIVEWADATDAERGIGLCNAGFLCAAWPRLSRWLERVRADNSKGEYYLTDVVALARADGAATSFVEAEEGELRGINSRVELAAAEAELQAILRRRAMEGGATLTDPTSVTLAWDTRLGRDVVVEPNVVFAPGVVVEDGATVRAFSHLERCALRRGAVVGPYARIRPGSDVGEGAHVGNFVELKATVLGAGAKANHLSYVGDATVGAGANIGAGTITCNYDGAAKHRTEIGAGAFVGSNTSLVAPVRVGARAVTAAGSVVTQDVPDDALALGRARQVNKPHRGMSSRGMGSRGK